MTLKQLPNTWRNTLHAAFQSPTGIGWALVISQIAALVWWGVALFIRQADLGVPVWYDQSITFTQATNFSDPYTVRTFLYPPWTVFLLFPNSLPPLPLSTLIQACLYFAILTWISFRYGGSLKTVLLTVTSFIAFDAVLELNIDWLVCIGLLVPPMFSGPFLIIKPQLALGVLVSFSRRDFIRMVIVLLLVILLSLLIWGSWPIQMLEAIRRYTLLSGAYGVFNIAPLSWLPVPLSLGLGTILIWRAFRKRDPVLSILAWVFFVPYLTLYSSLLFLALLAIRYFRLALIITISLWILYGGAIMLVLIRS